MSKKYPIFLIILLAVIVLTLVVYCMDIKNSTNVLKEQQREDMHLLEYQLLQHSDLVRINLPDSGIFLNADGQKQTAQQLTEGERRIGVYVDKSQCTTCWQSEVVQLAVEADKAKHIQQPFVLVSGYSVRELKILRNRELTKFPIYNIEMFRDLRKLTQYYTPFFFVLEPDGTISSIYFPAKSKLPQMDSLYFATALKKCQIDKVVHQGTPKPARIETPNDTIDLGRVPVNKKTVAIFHLRNTGAKKCAILEVSPTCTCVRVDNYSRILLPGETGEVRVAFLSADKGEFTRSILVRTDIRTEPYDLRLKGTVV